MESTALTILFIFLALPNLVFGLGINCRGCPAGLSSNGQNAATQLTHYISTINQSQWYEDVDLIACTTVLDGGRTDHICAFLQGTGGAPGSTILQLAHYIPDHGCHICGSVPFTYPSDNGVSNGELTYYKVDHACSNRLCNINGNHAVGGAKLIPLATRALV